MIDHITVYALDFIRTRDFYKLVFTPLGYQLICEFVVEEENGSVDVCGFGLTDRANFWIIESFVPYTPRHVAFTAISQSAVDAFYRAALCAGAQENGKPGLRNHYHEKYYAAFVIDPDGNDIEAVFHG